MEHNSTPTNELITNAAMLYVALLSELFIPAAVFATAGMKGRPVVFIAAPVACVCEYVEGAARFWDEKITTPLVAAHDAMHELTDVSLNRATTDYAPHSPFAHEARAEVKRLAHIIATSEAQIRREMRKSVTVLTEALADEVVSFLRDF